MSKKLLLLFVLILTTTLVFAQSITVSYEIKAGASNKDTVLVFMQSNNPTPVEIRGANLSIAIQSSCVYSYPAAFCSTQDTIVNMEYSYFLSVWNPPIFERCGMTESLNLDYNLANYNARFSYAISDATPPGLPFNSLAVPSASRLLVLKFSVDRTCVSAIYLENESENLTNQIGDVSFFSIPYNVMYLGGPTFPIELNSFDAEATSNDEVLLTWETEMELLNDYFSVEKSFTADFDEVIEIAKVEGAGTTDERQSYQHIDATPMAKTVYYRLKNVDLDGEFGYSNTVKVQFEGLELNVTAFPNPTKNNLNVRLALTTNQTYSFKLYDMQGRSFFYAEQELGPDAGSDFQVDMSGFPAGMYMLEVSDMKDEVKHLKISKN